MAVAWPNDYPKPLISGWGLEPAPLTVRSDMESGAARVRRISKQRNDKVSVQFAFTRQGFADFRTWYAATARNGVEWINMPVFTGQDGNCQQTETVRFIGQWSASALSDKYIRLTAEIEVRD